MTYSLIPIVCLAIHFVLNIDIFRKKATISLPAIREYRVFLVGVAVYFLTDILWGIFEENNLYIALHIDTVAYFISMGFTILAWARYLIKYLNAKGVIQKIILYCGNIFFLAEIVLLIINIFTPILFKIDPTTCEYTTYKARNIMLYVQFLFYILLLIYTMVKIIRTVRAKNTSIRRYYTIATYCVIMGGAISFQIYFPYLAVYSMGAIIGAALLSAFVINDIKEEYKAALAESREQVHQNEAELVEAKHIAYTDPLTNVKNKHAYVEEEDRIDKLIASGEMEDFAVAVFDLNGLKKVNDTKGHDAGDVYIVDSSKTIAKYFGSENLYRFGGDEFVVILTGDKYNNRSSILMKFESYIDSCLDTDKPIISSGMSKYKRGEDNTYHAVFYRADKIMYSRKEALKEHN